MESGEEASPGFIETFTLGGYEVTERLLIMCIRDILRKYSDKATQLCYTTSRGELAALLEKHGNIPAKGNLFENVVSHALCRPEFQNKKMSDLAFVKPFLSPQHKDGWLFKTTFHATKIWSHHHLTSSQTTSSFLASKMRKESFTRPKRPHGLIVLSCWIPVMP